MSTMRFLALTALILLSVGIFLPALASQPIYKVKDRDGNIIYTDEKPSPDAEPLELPELSVMGEDPQSLEDALEGQAAVDPGIDPLSLEIAQPADGAQITASGDGIIVALRSNIDLPPSAQIVLFIDDQPQEPVRQMSITLAGLEPGIHRLRAELQTPSGRVLNRTEEVTFMLRSPPELIPAP